MPSTLLDLSEKIDPRVVSVLREIQRVASRQQIPFFIVGAMARDLLLEAAHGLAPKRATADIDIAVAVENWSRFERFKEELLQSPDFYHGREAQRVVFRDKLPVDIVPFGGIAGTDGHIAWPPDRSFKMSVAGFEECHRHSIPVKLSANPDLVVQVVTLAGLAILKIVSWDDNPDRRRKDAPDLFFILQNYLDAGNLDRLFEEAPDLIEDGDSDYELTSARLLGRDISKIASHATKKILLRILERESGRKQGHRMAMDVVQSDGCRFLDYERVTAYFESLLKGLSEA